MKKFCKECENEKDIPKNKKLITDGYENLIKPIV